MARLLSSQVNASSGAGPAASAFALRTEEQADLPWLQHLYASTRSDELAPVPWPEASKRAFLQQQFALQRAHYGQHFAGGDFLIVQIEGLRIGRLYLHRTATHHTLVEISLLPEWRGQGIGAQLIAYAQAMACDAGCVLSLHVLHTNPAAQRLYRRLGFIAGDSTQTHLQMHWHPRQQPRG
ncbi:GNAT family N-acetyltransferase [Xanthomonas sp. NCPPB 1325]|uniref:GNAT family N-acetyltransferase n=1 Tax=Xanthomonas sp. NCPPB 1325 TaxID=487529 RepID=UPI00355778AE